MEGDEKGMSSEKEERGLEPDFAKREGITGSRNGLYSPIKGNKQWDTGVAQRFPQLEKRVYSRA